MTSATLSMAGYRATRDENGALIVHGVPIFVECEKSVGRGDKAKVHQFDAEWIGEAVLKAQQQEAEGYLAPLHIRHHGDDGVRAAGFFRVTGTSRIRFRGEDRLAVVADLVVTDEQAQREILQCRLPWRSVEILNVDKPSLDSLALLDHEVPFLRLPMLAVREVEGAVAGATVQRNPTPTVAAIFRRGRSAALLFQMDDDKKPDEKDEKKAAPFAKEGGNEAPEDGEQAAENVEPDVAAIVKAIADGSISVAGLQQIVEAIQARGGSGDAGQETKPEGQAPPKQKAQAPAPQQMTQTTTDKTTMTDKITQDGADAVKLKADLDATTVKMAALQGQVEGLNAKLAAREASDKRRDDVAKALKDLAGRPLGSDLEARLVRFHESYGGEAFTAYVGEMAKAVGVTPGGVAPLPPQTKKLPAVVMKYQDKGADAVEKAAEFAAEWRNLHETGHTRMTEERYVELSMNRLLAASAS